MKFNSVCRSLSKYFSSKASQNLMKTALNNYHKNKLKAKMVEFAGYEMPVQYPEGVMKEHLYCRNESVLFDVSHMGQVKIHGKDRMKFINKLVVSNIDGLKPEQNSCLSLILNEEAGIVDDTIVTKFTDHIHMVINGANKFTDLVHMDNVLKYKLPAKSDVKIEYIDNRALLALQGPTAAKYLSQIIDLDLQKVSFMKHFTFNFKKLNNAELFISRSGYTGEDGFEISVPEKNIEAFTDMFLTQTKAKFAGLGARDSLRLEAGLCLHGNDIDPKTTPLEGALMWTVRKNIKKDEDKFVGYDVLIKQQKEKSAKKKRVGFILEQPGTVRGHNKLFTTDGKEVGEVTSGTFSPVLQKGIGMAYVSNEFSKNGTKLVAKLRGKDYILKISKMPFVPTKYHKLE